MNLHMPTLLRWYRGKRRHVTRSRMTGRVDRPTGPIGFSWVESTRRWRIGPTCPEEQCRRDAQQMRTLFLDEAQDQLSVAWAAAGTPAAARLLSRSLTLGTLFSPHPSSLRIKRLESDLASIGLRAE